MKIVFDSEISMKIKPTARQLLQGYARFNDWELEEQKRELPRLTMEQGLTQFFELCEMARALAPNAAQEFLAQDTAHWIAVRKKLGRAAKVMKNEGATQRVARNNQVSRSTRHPVSRHRWNRQRVVGQAARRVTRI